MTIGVWDVGDSGWS